MPQCHAAALKKHQTAASAKEATLQKSPAMPGFSIFGDFIQLIIANYCSELIRGQNRLCEGRGYLDLRQSRRRLYGTWAGALKTYALTLSILAAVFSIGVEPRLKMLHRDPSGWTITTMEGGYTVFQALITISAASPSGSVPSCTILARL